MKREHLSPSRSSSSRSLLLLCDAKGNIVFAKGYTGVMGISHDILVRNNLFHLGFTQRSLAFVRMQYPSGILPLSRRPPITLDMEFVSWRNFKADPQPASFRDHIEVVRMNCSRLKIDFKPFEGISRGKKVQVMGKRTMRHKKGLRRSSRLQLKKRRGVRHALIRKVISPQSLERRAGRQRAPKDKTATSTSTSTTEILWVIELRIVDGPVHSSEKDYEYTVQRLSKMGLDDSEEGYDDLQEDSDLYVVSSSSSSSSSSESWKPK